MGSRSCHSQPQRLPGGHHRHGTEGAELGWSCQTELPTVRATWPLAEFVDVYGPVLPYWDGPIFVVHLVVKVRGFILLGASIPYITGGLTGGPVTKIFSKGEARKS